MSEYISHIDTDAVELELMERYLEGSLNEEEKKAMEENLAEDPILADALEGLALIEDKEAMKLALGRIQEGSRTRIDKYIKKRDQLSKRRSRVEYGNFRLANYYVAAAAAVAVLVCTVWVISISTERNDVAFNEVATAESETTSADQYTRSENEFITAAPLANDTLEEKSNEDSKELQVISSDESAPQIAMQTPLASESVVKQEKSYAKDEEEKESSLLSNEAEGLSDDELLEEVEPPSKKVQAEKAPIVESTGSIVSNAIAKQDRDDAVSREVPQDERKQEEITSNASPLGAASSIAPVEDTAPILSAEELNKIPLESKNDTDGYADEVNKDKRSRTSARSTKAKKAYYDTLPAFPEQSAEDKMYGKISKGQHMADLMLKAVSLYEQGSNDESLELLKEVLQSSPSNPAANYYVGSIYQRYSQMKTASSYLKEATKHTDSPILEDARWALAQVYLARNKNAMAKKLLLLIAKEGTKYAEQARAELIKLKY